MSKPDKQRCLDSRLYFWPKVFENSHRGMHLEARILTPSRFQAWRHVVLEPLSVLWGLAMGLLVVDGLLSLLEIWTVFAYIPCGRAGIYATMSAFFLLWHLELGSYYPFARFLLGRHLYIGIEGENLVIGGRFRRATVPLTRPVTFGLRKFDMTEDETFKRSARLELITDQVKRDTVVEILGIDEAEHIISNVNMMMQLGGEYALDEVDIDPNRFDDEDWE